MNDEQKAFINDLLKEEASASQGATLPGTVSHGKQEDMIHELMERIFKSKPNSNRETILPIVTDLVAGSFESYNRWISNPTNRGQAKKNTYAKRLVNEVQQMIQDKHLFNEDTFTVGAVIDSEPVVLPDINKPTPPTDTPPKKRLFRALRKIAKKESEEASPADARPSDQKDEATPADALHVSDLDQDLHVSDLENGDGDTSTSEPEENKSETRPGAPQDDPNDPATEDINQKKEAYDKLADVRAMMKKNYETYYSHVSRANKRLIDEMQEALSKNDQIAPDVLESTMQMYKRGLELNQEEVERGKKKTEEELKEEKLKHFNHFMKLFEAMFNKRMELALTKGDEPKFKQQLRKQVEWLIGLARQFAGSNDQYQEKRKQIIQMVNDRYFNGNSEHKFKLYPTARGFRMIDTEASKLKRRVEKGYMNQNAPNKDVFFTYRMEDIYSIIEDYFNIKLSVPIKESIESIVRSNVDEYMKNASESGQVATATIAHGRDVVTLIEQYINNKRNIHIKIPFRFRMESRSSLNELINREIRRYRNDSKQSSKSILSFINNFRS